MATKKNAPAPVQNDVEQRLEDAPEGFVSDSAVQDAPWFNLEEGAVLYGNLLGCYTMKTEPPRDYYQVELYQATTVRSGRGEDVEMVEAEKGDIVNVGMAYQLQAWKTKIVPLVEAGAQVEVFAKVGKKIKQKSGRTLWTFDVVKSRVVKAPTGPVIRPSVEDDSAQDAPF